MKMMASMEREMLLNGFSIISCGQFWRGDGSHFSNFGRGSFKEHFCEIILKSKNLHMRRCRLQIFSILSFGGHFVQRSRTILANLIKGHQRNISVVGWLVGWFGLNGPLRQNFSLYRAVSQREIVRKKIDRREKKCPNSPHPHLLQAQ